VTRSKPAARTDRPTFPEVEETIGEDPARFLAAPKHQVDTATVTDLCRARIRGIDFEATARAWIGVANALHQDGELSDASYQLLVGLLEDRIQWLDEHGDRDERMARQGRREISQAHIERKRERPDRHAGTASAKIARLRSDGGSE
jgi:hypothetical protein